MAAGHRREALRARSPFGQGAEQGYPQGSIRGPNLPDRSFFRQRAGPEHHGPALCERHPRAAVEARSHRACPDHGCRDARRRGTRPPLRAERRAKGHGAEPSVPARRYDRDGAANLLCSRFGARKKKELFEAIRTIAPEDAVRGQYGSPSPAGARPKAWPCLSNR